MPAYPVVFIDTSVLTNLLRVPGLCDQAEATKKEFDKLREQGAKFVIPVTTVIETGNHIAQVKQGDHHAAAERFCLAIKAAKMSSPPWTIRDVHWDHDFLQRLLDGDSTESSLEEHLTRKQLGTGDVAILVERDRFREQMSVKDVRIWTLDSRLDAHGARR